MGQACTPDHVPGPNGNDEHPVVAVLAVLAIVLASLLIGWLGFELHGTHDAEIEAAVTTTRFATGFSP